MLKFVDHKVTFGEIPDEISLCINISNCPFQCKGCHSPWLWKDEGVELTPEMLINLIKDHPGISCICFMGGLDFEIYDLISQVKIQVPKSLKWAWYTGQSSFGIEKLNTILDYCKLGPWKEECGPLTSPTTNQRLFRINHYADGSGIVCAVQDITYLFWKKDVE